MQQRHTNFLIESKSFSTSCKKHNTSKLQNSMVTLSNCVLKILKSTQWVLHFPTVTILHNFFQRVPMNLILLAKKSKQNQTVKNKWEGSELESWTNEKKLLYFGWVFWCFNSAETKFEDFEIANSWLFRMIFFFTFILKVLVLMQ